MPRVLYLYALTTSDGERKANIWPPDCKTLTVANVPELAVENLLKTVDKCALLYTLFHGGLEWRNRGENP